MNGERDGRIARLLARWVALCLRHGSLVVALSLAVGALGSAAAWRYLGFNLDPNDLFDQDLPFQRRIQRFAEHFPNLTDSLLVVVDGETPEAVREVANEIADRIRVRDELFRTVYFPGEESFFESRGLLYVDIDDLDTFADSLTRMQPLIAELSRDPSLDTLTWVVGKALEQKPERKADSEQWVMALEHFRRAVVTVYEEYPVRVSWESMLLDGSALDPVSRRVIVAEPILEFGRLLAAERPIEAVREAAAALGAAERGVAVRVTGYPALNHEEFVTLARDTGVAGALSLVLVVAILFLAFRSWRMVTAAAITLLVGFLWTAGYAAVVVGRLNPVSIAFAVLFIGLGIDFMIHLGMAVVESVRRGGDVALGAMRATRSTGTALLLCGVTTAIGFLAFLPTDYRGVSELGVISAGGMVVIVFLTLTLFPVLVAWALVPAEIARLRERSPMRVRLPRPRHPVAILVVAGVAGGLGILVADRVQLETNVVSLRNPETESVQAFLDLLQTERGTPWYLDARVPDLDRAAELATQLSELPEVRSAITLLDYVPRDQEEKLELLADVAMLLDLPVDAGQRRAPHSVDEQLAALRELLGVLDSPALVSVPSDLARSAVLLRERLVELLARVESDPQPAPALERLEGELLDSLPALLGRLRDNLDTPAIAVEDLPRGLRSRMLAADGQARVQVFPTQDIGEREAMHAFVEAVRVHWDEITGLPVNLVDSAAVSWSSLRQAVIWAVALIAGLLLLLWRRPVDVGFAMAPLLLAVLLTAASNVWFGISLNFINICVLPLILGIGADSGIHLVHRAQAHDGDAHALLESTTAQAVLYSALTTLASFGTLLISNHRGIATLGQLLMIGMLLTLMANLLVLPSLLALRRRVAPGA